MKIPYLPAIRWLRNAQKALPEPRVHGQSVPEKCREEFDGEVRWFVDRLAKARKRRG
jgi:hypothetical protein